MEYRALVCGHGVIATMATWVSHTWPIAKYSETPLIRTSIIYFNTLKVYCLTSIYNKETSTLREQFQRSQHVHYRGLYLLTIANLILTIESLQEFV